MEKLKLGRLNWEDKQTIRQYKTQGNISWKID